MLTIFTIPFNNLKFIFNFHFHVSPSFHELFLVDERHFQHQYGNATTMFLQEYPASLKESHQDDTKPCQMPL